MRSVIVGLDVGTTATKAVAFGVDGPWSRMALREYPLMTPRPGWRVQDPDVIVVAALEALAEVVVDTDVVGISLSTAMHGLIGLDADLTPRTPFLTWADGRSSAEANSLRTSGAAAILYEITGVPTHPMTPLTKLMWFGRDAAQMAHWVGLKDYVILRLTGHLVTELSSASGTGLLDRHRLRWSRTALEIAGISGAQLPEIRATTDQIPLAKDVASLVGLSAGVPVVLGAADGPLGNVGTGALQPGIVGLSLGTSGAARMVVPQSTIDAQGRLFCYALTDDLWVVGGAVSTGGSVVRWARRALGVDSDEELLQLAAQAPPGSEGLVMLPYLGAERAPLWNPDLPGAYLGLHSGHGREHMSRAALEGVAIQLGAVVASLGRVADVREVRATGGAFRSPLWREIVAGVLGMPLSVQDGAEGTARGAAALGLFGLGMSLDLEAALAVLQSQGVEPATEPVHVAAYQAVRERIPALIAAYDDVANLFGALA